MKEKIEEFTIETKIEKLQEDQEKKEKVNKEDIMKKERKEEVREEIKEEKAETKEEMNQEETEMIKISTENLEIEQKKMIMKEDQDTDKVFLFLFR